MPSYIYTASLTSLNKQKLQTLYRNLYTEYQAMPIGSDANKITKELLFRIQNILQRKTLGYHRA